MSERKIFWLKLVLYIFISIIVPALYMIIRFNLFNKVNGISVGVIGLIFIIIFGMLILKLFNQFRRGMKFGMAKQIINGICNTTIPLLIAIFVIYWMEGFAKSLIEILIVLVICETISIFINPIPKWSFDNNLEEVTDVFGIIWSKINKNNP